MGKNNNLASYMGLRSKLLLQTIIPLVLLLIAFFISSLHSFIVTINHELSVELMNYANLIEENLNTKYPGDYKQQDNVIYKGSQILNEHFDEFDLMKEKCDIDVTLFYDTIRVITTIGEKNRKIISTKGPEVVITEVLRQKKDKFYSKIMVNGVQYYAYYKPLYNSDGECIGMLFVGKPCWRVYRVLFYSMKSIIFVGLIGTLIIGIISNIFIGSIVKDVKLIKDIHSDISNGKLDSKIETNIINRRDEIGEIANSVVYMQHALKDIVELDALTGLLNRRSGMYKLQDSIRRLSNYQQPFHLAIGDIDFFKQVNDSYGHEAGDRVLKTVTDILKEMMDDDGYVVRWGGEEFLLVFEHMSYEEAANELNLIRMEIENNEIELANGTKISISMTFGLVPGQCESDQKLLELADELLYKGKENGRNQLVTIDS